jgi:hypothetical protein
MLEETTGKTEEASKLSRKMNITVNNVMESDVALTSETNKADEDFCCRLMTEVLRAGY